MTITPSLPAVQPPTSSTGRVPLDAQRLRRVKKSYTTRYAATALNAQPAGYELIVGPGVIPAVGDLVLARVVDIGFHKKLEGPASRRKLLFPGQEILLAYGYRYAPDQFLAEVPADLSTCHLIAAGGLAGVVTLQHAAVGRPTVIEPLGLLADAEGRLTLARYAPHAVNAVSGTRSVGGPLVVVVLGTSMNSGKSTTLAYLINGLTNAGLVVSAGKVTGTGAGGDTNMFRDAGATRVLDFTDFGLPSTFGLDPEQVRDLWASIVDTLTLDGPDVVVVEIADGLYQRETSRLLTDPQFIDRVDAIVFTAQDALGASAGVSKLRAHGLPVVAVSGVLTGSPLAAAEARAALTVDVIDTYDLCDPNVATALLPIPRGMS